MNNTWKIASFGCIALAGVSFIVLVCICLYTGLDTRWVVLSALVPAGFAALGSITALVGMIGADIRKNKMDRV